MALMGRDEAAGDDEIYPTPPRPTASCQPNGAPSLGGGMATRGGRDGEGSRRATGDRSESEATGEGHAVVQDVRP